MRYCKIAALMLITLGSFESAESADDVKISPDVVYGHKHCLTMTFDVFQPKSEANGVGVLFMMSGGRYSSWRQPERMRTHTNLFCLLDLRYYPLGKSAVTLMPWSRIIRPRISRRTGQAGIGAARRLV